MTSSTWGYGGKILWVDLMTSVHYTESTAKYAERFLGGRGLNQWLLLQKMGPRVDPFEPANLIGFGAGALVGTLAPGASRLNVDSKNPLTGGIGSGSAGGWFASELKFAGYDTVIVGGRAGEPVYLYIEDDRVFLKPARGIWGKTTGETVRSIEGEVGREGLQVLCIGPAGENLVRTACIVVSGARVVGRCGLGAVMGSKNLKAIAVRGTRSIGVREPDRFMTVVKNLSQRLSQQKAVRLRKEFGTVMVNYLHNAVSGIPYKNFDDDYFPENEFARISPEVFRQYTVGCYACTSCPCPCAHVYAIEGGPYRGAECRKLEANAQWDFGSRLGIDDPRAIFKAQEECCQLGLDIDNTGGAIAWAIDAFQNESLSLDDTGGLELKWGDHPLIISLLKKIAYREGLGDVLAEGSLRASRIIGKGSERFVFTVKGQDIVEAIRSCKGWALGIVVSPRGATHTRGAPYSEFRRWSPEDSEKTFGVATAGDPATYEGKARIVTYYEAVHALWDSLGICFPIGNWTAPDGVTPGELAELYGLVTGTFFSEKELMGIGERIHTLEKLFNVCHAGFTRDQDYPPRRLMEEPIKGGPMKGELLKEEDWNRMLDEYYSFHGWDVQTGWPTKENLRELGLQECIPILSEAEKMHAEKLHVARQRRGQS